MHNYCPVCFEYMFDSVDDVTVMPCSHTFHKKCLKDRQQHLQYACPLCFKSVCDMSKHWEILEMEIAATMPQFYQDKFVCVSPYKKISPLGQLYYLRIFDQYLWYYS